MSDGGGSRIGTINWFDLTVPDADRVRDFYRAVVGWDAGEVDMGGYSDFTMSLPGGGTTVAGICHARGANADLPPQWLLYVTVADLDASLEAVREGGGERIAGPREMAGMGRYAVVRDPAGAAFALWQDAGGG